jgi:nucleotide-binding universal stress UspA family protein
VFKTILLAVDGSEHSDKAVGAARDIARQFASDLLVLHVRERLVTRRGISETEIEEIGVAVNLAEALREEGINARAEEPLVPHGHIAKEIARVAETLEPDVIAMGSRGLSDVGGMFLGSVTHKVLHLVRCPVLVVR